MASKKIEGATVYAVRAFGGISNASQYHKGDAFTIIAVEPATVYGLATLILRHEDGRIIAGVALSKVAHRAAD